jgi:hypothetical protein
MAERKLNYGWIISLVLLVIGTVSFGLRFCFGIFFESIETEFHLSRAYTSSIASLYLALEPYS